MSNPNFHNIDLAEIDLNARLLRAEYMRHLFSALKLRIRSLFLPHRTGAKVAI